MFFKIIHLLSTRSEESSENDGTTIHVRGLKTKVRDEDLKELFERYGAVKTCMYVVDY